MVSASTRRILACAGFIGQLLIVSGMLPQAAAAQTRASEDPEYRTAIEEALQEFNRGNWEEAAALFERAHRLNPSARTLRGMGLTAYEARRYVDAIKHLNDALGETRRPLTQQQREEVSATLERARRFVAHLRVNVEPPNARVTINGRQAQPDGLGDIATDPGLLDVEISAEGYEPALRRVRLTAGGQEELNVQLVRVRTDAPASQATVAPQQPSAPMGATQPAPTDEGGGAVGTLKWVVGGVAVAGLITGGVLLAMQQSKAAQFERDCGSEAMFNPETPNPYCDDLRQTVAGTLWNATIITFSVGGGLAAVATVLFIVDATDDDAPASAKSGCGFGTGDLGVSCQLKF